MMELRSIDTSTGEAFGVPFVSDGNAAVAAGRAVAEGAFDAYRAINGQPAKEA